MEFKDLHFAYPMRPDVPVLRCVCVRILVGVNALVCDNYGLLKALVWEPWMLTCTHIHDRGLNLKLQPGTVTSIVGPSGAGKTTITQILSRCVNAF